MAITAARLEQEKSRKTRRVWFHIISATLWLLLAIGLFYGLRPLLLPILMGAFLGYVCKPLVRFGGSSIKKRARSIGLLLVLGLSFYWVGKTIKESWPNDQQKLVFRERLRTRCHERYESWMGLDHHGHGNFLHKIFGRDLDPVMKRVYVVLKTGPTSEDVQTPQAVDMMYAFTIWIMLPITFLFVLFDRGQILHFFIRLAPNRYFELAHSLVENVDEALGRYIRGTMLEGLLVGITLAIGFFICGIDPKVAILIGSIGGLTNAIPFVGTLIACLIGVIYALVADSIHPLIPFINIDNLALAVVCVVVVTHLLDNAIYQPMIVGHAAKIHPLVVMVGVMGGSMMFGFAGLIFAVPTIMVVKVVVETLYSGLKAYRII